MENPRKSRISRLLRGGPRPVWIRYLLLVAAASGMVRFALDTQWMRESAMLYIAVPYLVGVLIYLFVPQPVGEGFGIRLWSHVRAALIVMLATSLLLFEGFLCVVMFMPIYFLFSSIVIAFMPNRKVGESDAERLARIRETFRVSALPLLVLFLSLDGIRGLGPDRDTVVSRTAVLDLSPAEIRANIIDHPYPDEGRSLFLSLFPRPVHVEAKSLAVGARHTAHMEYRRWGVPFLNVHRGTAVMEFTRSDPHALRARFVHDDSYLSHYMRFDTWAMDMTPRSDGTTNVTITLRYHRKLAPAWYFGPAMERAVGDGLDYALSEIITASAHTPTAATTRP